MQRRFDIAVIGGGPGGYVAAIRAAKDGKKTVALIEAEHMGGTCLNWGCIPTKTLIANAEVLHKIRHAEEFGISTGKISFDFAKMSERKDKVVQGIRQSLEQLIAAHKITVLRGRGEFISPREIKVKGQDHEIIYAEKTIIATGSQPRNVPAFPFDHELIHSSSSILGLKQLPKSLVIIGGGVIGCEFASLYQEMGVEVTILEALPSILSLEAKDISKYLTQALQRRGITIKTDVKVERIDKSTGGVSVVLVGGEKIESEMALVAVGRKLNTDSLGLEKAGIATTPQSVIPVNDKMETSVAGIYAIGDITAKMMLAHVASHQGIVAADNALGKTAYMHYNAIPSIIFTHPEVASVGMSLEKALEFGYQAKVGKFPFHALGKAQAAIETEGFAQVVIDEKTGQILGAQVIGEQASSLIAEMGLAIAQELTVESVADTVHAHPSLPEAWLEAALMSREMAIHLPPKNKAR
ncbi:MAG: lpdA [Chlamydiales bacterium]|jgi:dihydrolipoamide dehydrogenase|nr:lpdA [Chlamydiales bacterium]